MGFSVPLRARGAAARSGTPSKAVLGESNGWASGSIPTSLRNLLQRHRQGVGDHAEMLWAVLVLARFLERWS